MTIAQEDAVQRAAPRLEITNATKEVTKSTCQNIYWNALEALHAVKVDDPLQSTCYLRELYQTQRCDMFHDLSHLRADMVRVLNQDRMERLVVPTQEASEKDILEGHYAVRHYQKRHRVGLKSALSPLNWIKYHVTT